MRESLNGQASTKEFSYSKVRYTGLAYSIAISATLLLVGLRLTLPIAFENRPMFILYMLPIILSAILGGMGPGFTATILSAALVDYFLIPPIHSFAVHAIRDNIQLGFFLICGFLVSYLCEFLHKLVQSQAIKREQLGLAQNELQQIESRFKAVFEQAAVGIAIVSPQGDWLQVNQKICEIVAYPQHELLSKSFQDISYHEDLPADLAKMHSLLRAEIDGYSIEKRYIRKDGKLVWVLVDVSLVRNADGSASYFIACVQDIQEKKQALELLSLSEADLRLAHKMAGLGKWQWDVLTDRHTWSEEIYRIYGRDLSLPPAKYPEVKKYFTAESWDELAQAVQNALATGEPYQCDLDVVRADGTHRWIVASGEAQKNQQGQVIYMHGTLQDITERKSTEQQLQFWGKAFKQAEFALSISDAVNNTFLAVNPAFARQRGYTVEEMVGQSVFMVFPQNIKAEMQNIIQDIDQEGHGICESTHLRKNGSTFPVLLDLTVIKSASGKVISRLAYVMDITDQIEAKQKIHNLAYFDPLTGLPNRTLLMDRLSQVSSMSGRKHTSSALILFNIDHFKMLNDARGYAIGDELLKLVAAKLKPLLREADTLARLGGDEFGILLFDLNHAFKRASHNAAVVASKVHDVINQPFFILGDEVFITASLGITLFPETEHDTADNILRRANTALHKAKKNNGNQTVFFESEMGQEVELFFDTEHELHQALERQELRLYLQSQVNFAGEVVGAEALVRWQHPSKGLVSPISFIWIAETTDLICSIDLWMFTEVCRFLTLESIQSRDFTVSVNISARHFYNSHFVNQLKSILQITGAPARRITLEVTESLVIKNIDDVISKMEELIALGFRFSIDDFGTGYSSLSYLKRLPIKEIKIDKVFVQDAPQDPDDAAVVEIILAVAQKLHLEVVAEGVETREQVDFLNARGPVIYQGYYFAKPQAVEEWVLGLKAPT